METYLKFQFPLRFMRGSKSADLLAWFVDILAAHLVIALASPIVAPSTD